MSARQSGRPNRTRPASEKVKDAAGSAAPADPSATDPTTASDDDIEILEVIGVNETEPMAGEMAPLAELPPIDPDGAYDHGHGAHGAGHGSAHQADDDLRQRLDEAEKEKERLHDLWLRAQAETANVRKRLDREAIERRARETAERIRALLPVLDSLERAIESPGWGDDGLRQGVALILQQMLNVLGQDGLKPIESKGARFDPQVHEAVETVAAPEVPEGTVLQEMQRGYLLRDRLIRPALVKVSAAAGTVPAQAPIRRRAAGG
jgi:molecular chaperone GrpE